MSAESTGETLKKSYDHKKLNMFNSHKNLKTHKSKLETDAMVERLVNHYGNPQFIPLYRKAAWYLSEATIINFMDKAESADASCNYFVRCAKNALSEMRKI